MVMNRNFTALCAAVLAFALLITVYCNLSAAVPAMALAEEQKTVYLTFDDGPSDRVTPKILDVLSEEDVKATFFIIGRQAETRENIIRREFEEGHTVGVHSYSHIYSEIYSSPERLLKDIDRCNAVISRITGCPASIYRFPGGSYNLSEPLITAVTTHGMRYVDWNASFRDAEIPDPTAEQLFNAAVTTVANPARIVMLAHDSTAKSATAEALSGVIKHYKELGYTFSAL